MQDVAGKTQALGAFVVDRLKFLFEKRGYRADEIAAVLPEGQGLAGLSPLSVRQRLDALRVGAALGRLRAARRPLQARHQHRQGRAAGRSRHAWISRRSAPHSSSPPNWRWPTRSRRAGRASRRPSARPTTRRALLEVAALRPAVDRFFTEVFVMVDDAALRQARLSLLAALRDTVRGIADLSAIAGPQA